MCAQKERNRVGFSSSSAQFVHSWLVIFSLWEVVRTRSSSNGTEITLSTGSHGALNVFFLQDRQKQRVLEHLVVLTAFFFFFFQLLYM